MVDGNQISTELSLGILIGAVGTIVIACLGLWIYIRYVKHKKLSHSITNQKPSYMPLLTDNIDDIDNI